MRIGVVALAMGALAALGVARATPASAHDFPAPSVTVYVSDAQPATHPDLQTAVEALGGPGFDQVRIVSPRGSGIARDADIRDGEVVGRLDAEATTNAITRPACDTHVAFSVPIVEATADPSAPGYPAYLKTIAPGRHRIRFVAVVSPSPDVPVSVNYLFDVKDDTVVSTVIVGDPEHPPARFRSCTPQKSLTTLFGVTPSGTPLLTSPASRGTDPPRFDFTFTSRPDKDGHRHESVVRAFAYGPPIQPAGVNLALFGASGRLSWNYPHLVDGFVVEVVIIPDAGAIAFHRTTLPSSARAFEFGSDLVPRCHALVIYRVAATVRAVQGPFAQTEAFLGCAEGPENPPAPDAPPAASAVRPSGLALAEVIDGGGVYLRWQHPDALRFDVRIIIVQPAGEPIRRSIDVSGATEVPLPTDLVAYCDDPGRLIYLVRASGRPPGPFVALFGDTRSGSCIVRRPPGGLQPPDHGAGTSPVRLPNTGAAPSVALPAAAGDAALSLLLVGAILVMCGRALRRTRGRANRRGSE